MDIAEFLSPDDTLVDVKAPDKPRLLHDLAARAATHLQVSASDIAEEVLRREQLGSTGMGHGIAIPHAKLQGVDRAFGLFARLRRPIDFQAIDGQPVDLVFLLLQPAAAASDLNALASVARKLREPDRLTRLRRADDVSALYREITQ